MPRPIELVKFVILVGIKILNQLLIFNENSFTLSETIER